MTRGATHWRRPARPAAGSTKTRPALISAREGINVVLSGAMQKKGAGYALSVRAVDAVNGKELGAATRTADGKGDVLKVVAEAASDIRRVLGDTKPTSAKLAAAETVTAASLEALSDYSRAQDLLYDSKDEEAMSSTYKRAMEEDPNFGRAYSGWAMSTQEPRPARGGPDGVEQGRLSRRPHERAGEVPDAGQLLHRRPAQLREGHREPLHAREALSLQWPGATSTSPSPLYLRNFPKALEHGKRSVEVARGDVVGRANYALYAMYAGDFVTAAAQANAVIKQDPTVYRMYLQVAMAALAGSDFQGANATYEAMTRSGNAGASLVGNLGLADVAIYQGRFADAEKLLTEGIAVDKRRGDTAGWPRNTPRWRKRISARGRHHPRARPRSRR